MNQNKNTKIIFIIILIFIASLPLVYKKQILQYQSEQTGIEHTEEVNETKTIEVQTEQQFSEEAALDEDWNDMKQTINPCMVKIHCGEYMGSGMVLAITDENIVIVTNKHLAQNGSTSQVDFFQGVSAEGEGLGFSQQYDIAFVKVAVSNLAAEQLEKITCVDTSIMYDTDVYVGEEVLQVGSTDGPAANSYVGQVTAIDQFEVAFYTEMLVTDCQAYTGMSGGGVFDTQGRLIAMITGGDMTEETRNLGTDVTYSIPITMILEEYSNY